MPPLDPADMEDRAFLAAMGKMHRDLSTLKLAFPSTGRHALAIRVLLTVVVELSAAVSRSPTSRQLRLRGPAQ